MTAGQISGLAQCAKRSASWPMPKVLPIGENPDLIHCRICGELVVPYFPGWKIDGVCSRECYDEFDWRRALSTLRKAYYPRKQ